MNAPRVMALDTKVPTKTIIYLEVGKSCLISYIFCSVPSLQCLFWLAAQPAALSMLICRNCYCSFLLNIGQGEGGVLHFSVLMVSNVFLVIVPICWEFSCSVLSWSLSLQVSHGSSFKLMPILDFGWWESPFGLETGSIWEANFSSATAMTEWEHHNEQPTPNCQWAR